MNQPKRTIFITGASSGIGAGIARQYAKKGYQLALFARRKEKLEKVKKDCLNINPQCRVVLLIGDVQQRKDLDEAFLQCHSQLGPVDTLIANAGYGVKGYFERLDIEIYREQFETNIFGVLNTLYAGLEDLKETQGRLVLMGSVNSYIAIPSTSAYCMTKFALRALSETLQIELKKYKITTTLICPGKVESEIVNIDNYGKFHESPPSKEYEFWMKTDPAAKEIVSSIEKRKIEQTITRFGKVLIFLSKHCPQLTRYIIHRKFS